MSIGNVNSDKRGSGARYNDGKPAMELIPLWILAETLSSAGTSTFSGLQRKALSALSHLGGFQATGDSKYITSAIASICLHINECAKVLDFGRGKYAAWNWAKGMPWSVPLGCATRHIDKIMRGEMVDEESGLPIMGHVLANLVMLRQFVEFYPEGNDLPRPELFVRRTVSGMATDEPETNSHEAPDACTGCPFCMPGETFAEQPDNAIDGAFFDALIRGAMGGTRAKRDETNG